MGLIDNKFNGEFEKKPKPMDVSNINTDGKFAYRIKPDTEHHPKVLNRAIEELQKIIVDTRLRLDKLEGK